MFADVRVTLIQIDVKIGEKREKEEKKKAHSLFVGKLIQVLYYSHFLILELCSTIKSRGR